MVTHEATIIMLSRLELDGLWYSRGRIALVFTGAALMCVSAAGKLTFFSPHSLVDWLQPHSHFMVELISGTAFGMLAGFLWAGIVCVILALTAPLIVAFVERMLSLESGKFLFAASVMALVLRVAWFAAVPTFPVMEPGWFHERAIVMAQGLGYLSSNATPTAYWPIGYPLFLSVLYRLWANQTIAQMFNLGLSVGIMTLSYALIRKRAPEDAARITVLLLAVSLAEISFVNILTPEILLASLAVAALGFYLDSLEQNSLLSAMLAGALTGAAMLVRPVALLFPLVYMVMLSRSGGNRMKRALLFPACCAAIMMVLLPNIVRNYAIFQHIIPVSTNGGINFWIGNNPVSNGGYGTPPELPATGEVGLDHAGYAQGFNWIIHNPGSAAVNCLKKFVMLWLHDDHGVLASYMGSRGLVSWGLEAAALIIGNLFYLTVLFVAVQSAWSRRRSFTLMEQFFVLLIFAWTAFHLVYFGADRFHFPVLTLIFYFAGIRISEVLTPRGVISEVEIADSNIQIPSIDSAD